jgi:glucokinase
VVTVGVDIGGTNIQVVVLGDSDEQLGASQMRTPLDGDRTNVLEVVDAAINDGVGAAGLAMDDIAAIGVGTPGVVIDGTVGGAANMPGLDERFSLKTGIEQRIDQPVRVVNDVTAAGVGEHRLGGGRGADDLLAVFVGTGVGGGLVLGGRPYEGAFGGAGEFGHTVVQVGGAVCPCGRRGCVEAYAGRRAMENAVQRAIAADTDTIVPSLIAERGKTHMTSGVVRDALAKGDPLIADLVDEAIDALAAGIASAVNLLDVERVVLGGGLADKLGPPFRHRVEAAMRPSLFMVPSRVEVVAAELGDEGGALGAALLARD